MGKKGIIATVFWVLLSWGVLVWLFIKKVLIAAARYVV